MKHLKKFETAAAYNVATLDLPNVSLIEETMSVYYNNVNNADLIIKYAVDTDDPVQLYFYNDEITEYNPFLSYGVNAFNNIEIDGVNVSIADLDENKGKYAFTSGEHTVKYILKKPLIGITGDNFDNVGALFATCDNIKDVIINISNDTIFGGYVFAGCIGLTSIDIPSNVTSIANSAFSGCNGLTSITVDNNNTVYDSRNNCNAIIETSTNTLISGCKNTVIPDSVTSIGANAFSGCSGLTNINIPGGVTNIGASAFSDCSSLTSIDIPDSITNIDGGALFNCSNLVSVTVNSITPPTLYAGSAPGEPMYPGSFDRCSSDLKIYVPAESVETYKATEGWSHYADIILPIE